MPKPYPPEFRRRALDLVRAGRTIAQVAGDLQISESVLYSWRRQELIDSGQRPGVPTVQAAELVAAKRRIRELEAENEILRRASVALREAVPPKAKFGLVADLAVHGFEIKQACRVLGVSAAGFYEWRHRAPSLRAIRHAWLTDMITEVHGQSRGVYGAHRVRAELLHGRGILVGHNAVARLMQQAGLAGLPNRRARHQPPRIATATDLVDRRFARAGPDQLWVTDITEHRTREGKVYCCVVLDAYSRRVVGWSIDSAATSALATNALGMAIANRGPSAGGIIHSDHGVQFTSWAFTDRAKRCGLLPSMGSVGDAYDNAVIESFWGRMQTELLDRHRWRTRTELANAIFDYLEVFHNRRRRHSALGMLTPIEFELQHSAGLAPSVLA